MSAHDDALEIAKVAAMFSGQLKQVDKFTSTTVNSSKGNTNQLNPELIYHSMKQSLQTTEAEPPPPPVSQNIDTQPVNMITPVTIDPPPVLPLAQPAPASVALPQNNELESLTKAVTALTKKITTLTTAINKLNKAK